jgi:secondary thiamine-phosphate synthase enzyme
MVDTTHLTLTTGGESTVVDITGEAAAFCAGKGGGLLSVFLPHATAGLALIETGAGSDHDLLAAIDRLIPPGDGWRHQHGSPGHGRDHVLPAFVSPSLVVPVEDGILGLGTWQSIVLVDTNADNQRRSVTLSFLAG